MRDDLYADMTSALDRFLASAEGRGCTSCTASSAALRNRIEVAFARGYEAARRDAWIRRSCASKVRHSTEAKALASAAHVASKRHIRGMHAYRCQVCQGWHLTKQERRG